MLEVVGGLAGLIITLGSGLFLMRLGEHASALFSASNDETEPARPALVHSRVRWAPLDLEPYPMPWPSEREEAPRRLPEMRWPSESWDDPQFGPGKRGTAAAPITTLTGNAPLEDPAPARPRRHPASETRSAVSQQGRDRTNPQQLAEAREEAWFEETGPRPAPPTQGRKPPERPAQPARPTPAPRQPQESLQGGTPDAEILRQWVAQIGLAGAVTKLRDHTGMDFKTAARHLAEVIGKGR